MDSRKVERLSVRDIIELAREIFIAKLFVEEFRLEEALGMDLNFYLNQGFN